MKKIVGWTDRYVLPLLVLAGAFYGSRRLIASRPEAVREQARSRVVAVEVVYPLVTNHVVMVEALGKVVAAKHVDVRAQVGGRIIALHRDFEVGGRLRAGDVLVEMEREDYEAALAEAESAYAQAVLVEAMELQRQTIARQELQQDGTVLDEGPGRAIALREPQVEAARRSRAAAAAAVARARRNLDRTRIQVPFDAVVLRKTVDLGSVLAPQSSLAELASLDRLHVEAVLPPRALGWLPGLAADGHFAGRPAVNVGVEQGTDTVWHAGYLSRLVGDLRGNMARVMVVVEPRDPANAAPLLLGSFVQVRIAGNVITDVLAIPRRALREDGSVLLANEESGLVVLHPDVAWTTQDTAFLRSGLNPGDRVITTPLSAAVPGMPLDVRVSTEAL
jgi:RND family efflux transporter MFP subunit